jgi:glutamate racemase
MGMGDSVQDQHFQDKDLAHPQVEAAEAIEKRKKSPILATKSTVRKKKLNKSHLCINR